MPTFAAFAAAGRRVTEHRPWPRIIVDERGWRGAAEQLGEGHATLLGLWGEADAAHMAVLSERNPLEICVLSIACPTAQYPSVAQHHPPAMRLERAMRDLFGLDPVGLPDQRPWLDHGKWGIAAPLAVLPRPASGAASYEFLPVEGESLHEVPVGPVHAGIIEPGHFRFTADGETVVRLEERLGYTHKGVESLLAGAAIDRAAKLVGRCSGDSTVAYAYAFAHAVESALGLAPPPRAAWLRAAMAELERIANHLGDFGAVCNDAAFAIMLAHCAILRERVLRAAARCFGHRLMMDRIVPGGVASDLDPDGADAIRALIGEIRPRLAQLADLYDKTASLQDRTVSTGIVPPGLVRRFGAGGYVGRASGRDFDARRAIAYPPYDTLRFEVSVRQEGDVNARVWVRIAEIEQSLSLLQQILTRLPAGPVRTDLPESHPELCEGVGLVEGFRGDVLVWLRLGIDGRIARCHMRDPSWFQWPLLEAAIDGNIIADFPLCNKSFNCSYSGADM
jgi:Ni,Fe-hydrogenase III large subunit